MASVQQLAARPLLIRVLRRRGRHAEAFAGPGAQVDLAAALARPLIQSRQEKTGA